jgi:hypothetical protein
MNKINFIEAQGVNDYKTPYAEVLDFSTDGILCGSVNNGFNADTDEDDNGYGYETFPW